jgi:hypothetical protein
VCNTSLSAFPQLLRHVFRVLVLLWEFTRCCKNTDVFFYLRIPLKDQFPRVHHTTNKTCSIPSVSSAVSNGSNTWREHSREQTLRCLNAILGATRKHYYTTQCLVLEQHRFFVSAPAQHTSSHPDNTASATQSPLMHAEKCIATRGGSFHHLMWNPSLWVWHFK